jgi:hypothetical protein
LAIEREDEELVRLLLEADRIYPGQSSPWADCQDGEALVRAATIGHEAIVRMLLGWPHHAPRADCQDGEALVQAAAHGHETVVRMLLDSPHAPRGDCQDGEAIHGAIQGGHDAIARLLRKKGKRAGR